MSYKIKGSPPQAAPLWRKVLSLAGPARAVGRDAPCAAPSMMPEAKDTKDTAIFRGDLLGALLVDVEDARKMLEAKPDMSAERASATLSARLVLRAAFRLEGWAVSLARWMLEAAATGAAQPGRADQLLEHCAYALDPPPPAMLDHIRTTGAVARSVLTRALGQCASAQKLFEVLSTRAGRGGIDEFTRFYWRPLHFAAAFGSLHVVESLLSLSPSQPAARNAIGLTPLHVATAHGSTAVAAALSAAFPDAVDIVDKQGRSAAQVAAEVAPSGSRCRSMLVALRLKTAEARRRCDVHVRKRKVQRDAVAAVPPPPLPRACEGGGGWVLPNGEGSGECVSNEGDESDQAGVGLPRRHDNMAIDHACSQSDACVAGSDASPGPTQANGATAARRASYRSCHVAMVESIEAIDLIFAHLSTGVPVLVTNAMAHSRIYQSWTRDAFEASYGHVVLSPEPYPYARASAHLYGVPADNSTDVRTLLRDWTTTKQQKDEQAGDDSNANCGGASRSGVFNALHGWDRLRYDGPTTPRTVHGDVRLRDSPRSLPPSRPERLLADFERPSFIEEPQWLLRTETIQFYLGARESGAQPHWHGAAWNWLVHGSKRWFLWPPSEAFYTQSHVTRHVGHDLGAGPALSNVSGSPLICDQRAGEVLVVPELWGHATYNLAGAIGWASEMTFDRVPIPQPPCALRPRSRSRAHAGRAAHWP